VNAATDTKEAVNANLLVARANVFANAVRKLVGTKSACALAAQMNADVAAAAQLIPGLGSILRYTTKR